MILDGDLQREWRRDETRQSRVVFIGRGLDQAAIRDGFFGLRRLNPAGLSEKVVLQRVP
jgi:G3E family GTPase